MQYHDNLSTPLGTMEVTADDAFVTSIYFVDNVSSVNGNALTSLAKQQLHEYFSGQRHAFTLPTRADGTDFQKRVWSALSGIQYASTCSYSDIAHRIGQPQSVRAVGAANGRNPLTIVVPCHRVIGANGKLTGYASGVDRKAWLLEHETRSRCSGDHRQVVQERLTN